MKNVVGVIPARYASSRFEGKVLADLWGKPLIQHVWERASQARMLDEVIIACDDKRVAEAVERFGGRWVMTSASHTCGTDRLAEVVNPLEVRVVVNIQGDEPLIHPSMIDGVAAALCDDHSVAMATVMKRIDDTAVQKDPNVVKVVVDKQNFALYFSRGEIPYHAGHSTVQQPVYYKHIGLYAYTKDFLFIFKNLPVSSLEETECLEQLRVLQEGCKIKVIETEFDSCGVDTPDDLERMKVARGP